MFLEQRAYVQYETDKRYAKIPVEFIKHFETEDFSSLKGKRYEVFWSNDPEDTPDKIFADQEKIINVDDEIKTAKGVKEKERLRKAPGYYYAKIIAVKANLKDLNEYLDNKGSRKDIKDKPQEFIKAVSKNNKKPVSAEDTTRRSRKKTLELVKSGASASLKRFLPPNFAEEDSEPKLKSTKYHGAFEDDSDSQDSDDEFRDASLITETELKEKLSTVEWEWKHKYSALHDKYQKLKTKYNDLNVLFVDCHKMNIELQKVLCERLTNNGNSIKISSNIKTSLKNSSPNPSHKNRENRIKSSSYEKTVAFTSEDFLVAPDCYDEHSSNNTLEKTSPKIIDESSADVSSLSSDPKFFKKSDLVIPSVASKMCDESLFSNPSIIRSCSTSSSKSINSRPSTLPLAITDRLTTQKAVSTHNPKGFSNTLPGPNSEESSKTMKLSSQFNLDNNLESNFLADSSLSNEKSPICETNCPPFNTDNKYNTLDQVQKKLVCRHVDDGIGGDSKFIRNVVEIVFTDEVLFGSCVHGKKANNKKDLPDKFRRPALDKDGLNYVEGLFKERIKTEWEANKREGDIFNEDRDVKPRLKFLSKYINSKISTLRKAEKDSEKKDCKTKDADNKRKNPDSDEDGSKKSVGKEGQNEGASSDDKTHEID